MSRRKTKNQSTNDALNTSISPCIICLDEVRVRGKITVCDHWFCFACIREWSKNTNTCPICKARFRTISKVHLGDHTSPLTKVRVPDKDQRVWNDDDDIAMEDLIDDLQNVMPDEMDSDYQPPNSSVSGWTRAHISDEDDYDFNDSFIDDSNISQGFSYEEHFYLDVDSDIDNALSINADDDDDDDDDDDSSNSFSSDFDDDESDHDSEDDSDDDSEDDGEDDSDSSFDYSFTQDSFSARESSTSRPKTSQNVASRSTKSTRTKSSKTRTVTKSSSSSKTIKTTAKRKTKSGPAQKTNKKKSSTKTRSNFRPRKQQTQNQRQQYNATIAQRFQETGSSGWIRTLGRNRGRPTSTTTATRQSGNSVSHQEHSRRSNRIATSRCDDNPADVTVNDSDVSYDDLQIVSPSKSQKCKTARNKQSRANVITRQSQTISSDSDDDFNAHLASLQQQTTNNQQRSLTTRSLRSLENTTYNLRTNQQGSKQTKGNEKKRGHGTDKGKENAFPGSRIGVSRQKKVKLQQTSIHDYSENSKTSSSRGKNSRKTNNVTNRRGNASSCYGNYSASPSTSTSYYDDENHLNNYIDDYDDDDYDDDTITYKDVKESDNCTVVDGGSKTRSYKADSDTDNDTVVLPTPQDKNKRSLFTKRQHKTITCGFDDDDDDDSESTRLQSSRFKVTTQSSSRTTLRSPVKKKSRRRIMVYGSDSD